MINKYNYNPANDNPNIIDGRIKKTPKQYKMANHL
jgi:hypothetical protein